VGSSDQPVGGPTDSRLWKTRHRICRMRSPSRFPRAVGLGLVGPVQSRGRGRPAVHHPVARQSDVHPHNVITCKEPPVFWQKICGDWIRAALIPTGCRSWLAVAGSWFCTRRPHCPAVPCGARAYVSGQKCTVPIRSYPARGPGHFNRRTTRVA
jgi:hypothetical protein